MANLITVGRIILSALLLTVPAFSVRFGIIYLLAGFTDIIDGAVARKTNTVSNFGAKLDTVADFIFVAICFIKILPQIDTLVFLYVWIGMIAIVKLINAIVYFAIHKKLIAMHTVANKIAGALLFVFPLTIPFIDPALSGSIVCSAATFAAIQEGYLIGKNVK